MSATVAQALLADTQREVQTERSHKFEALRAFAPVGLLLVLALALRLWGITWALPNQDRYFTYHPDEGVNLAQGVLDNGQPRPHLDLNFYNYGGLYFYLWQGAVSVNRAYSVVALPPTGDPKTPSSTSIAAMILVGRLMTVVLGTLTVWAVFSLGQRLFGRPVGLLAGLIWAIAPAAVVHGHYATVDVPATFFVAVALVFAAKLLGTEVSDRSSARTDSDAVTGDPPVARTQTSTVLLAGLFCGLAAATKYNCGIVLFAPLAAVVLRARSGRPLNRSAAPVIIAMAGIGFLAGCPGVILNPTKFWTDFSFELTKSQQGMGLLFAGTGSGWWYHLGSSMRVGLGLPLLILSLLGVSAALVRRAPQDKLGLAFIVPYYLLIGWAQVRFLRYILPLLPVLAVFAARFAIAPMGTRTKTVGVRAFAAGAVGFTLLLSLAIDRMFVTPDTRDQAKTFLDTLPRGSAIAFVWLPWFHAPPLAPHFTAPRPDIRDLAARSYADKILHIPSKGSDWWKEWDASLLGPPLPDAFAVSEFETGDAVRLGIADAKPFLALWREHYSPRVFEKTPSIFGIDFGKPAYTPNDWLYPNPRTTVYTLRHP